MASGNSIIWATVVMGVIAAVLTAIAASRGGGEVAQGWLFGGKMLLQIVPLLVFAFVIAGLAQVMIPKEVIANWLGEKSGLRGIILGCFAGSITPGGPFISFPIVATLQRTGADVGTIVAFITAWSLWGIQRLPLEIAVIGPRMALVRFLSTFLFAPLAGIIARIFFSGFARQG